VSGNNVWTGTAAGQGAYFVGRKVAGVLAWMLVTNLGGTLS
jgi:hypothetical protein